MNTPNKLTLLRIAFVPFIILIYLFPYSSFGIIVPNVVVGTVSLNMIKLIVFVLFVMASFTDFLDGHIARKYHLITTFGKFADPIADKLLVNTILLLLASDQTIPIIICIIMIARDIVVDAIRLVASGQNRVLAASNLGKLKTVCQMIAIGLLLLDNFPFVFLNIEMDLIMIWVATFVSFYSGFDYFMKNKDILMETM
ncbi:CDP-diacylglycerol--glycerol-3-phosphate 3-phosphatidyltransferase [Tannockella kyphosi]|uniref:CDP-diacylglycerol--glycerol-3-phosphate 3-phosphatidyltransferase n=1 Tax=Tannockella kyphosi TaxID=2899121 RepID=UPI0020130DFD|nr:CDP-diacylglycerol--glycerol-3-phosphate 3-phosphatidyltransferase [Tannockella kyphosi]